MTVSKRGQRHQTGSALGSTDRKSAKRRSTQLEIFNQKIPTELENYENGRFKDGRVLLRRQFVGASEIGL